MTNRERFAAAIKGAKPDRIPYLIYGGHVTDANYHSWAPFIERGLCVMPRVKGVKETAPDVTETVENFYDARSGYNVERRTIRTPAGEISRLSHDGWVREYFVKSPCDYAVIEYILRNTALAPDFDDFYGHEAKIGDAGVTIVRAERSPLQKIIVDYAGLENFSYHMADAPATVDGTVEVLNDYLKRYYAVLAGHPSAYIQIPENLTSEQSGPARYKKYHMPFYEMVVAAFRGANKKLFAHYDGKIACLAELITETGLDGVESFTAPPEGDLTYADARRIMPDMIIMANIGLSDYFLPPDELKKKIAGFIECAAPDGRGLIFEISEDLPVKWSESIPVVLDAIESRASI